VTPREVIVLAVCAFVVAFCLIVIAASAT